MRVPAGAYISPEAEIDESVLLGEGVQIYGPVRIGAGSVIDMDTCVGYPTMTSIRRAQAYSSGSLAERFDQAVESVTTVGAGATIRRGSVIYEGCSIGDGLDSAHSVVAREHCSLGNGVELGPLAYLKRSCRVGDYTRIAAEICDRTVVGSHCTVYGRTVHRFLVGVSGVEEQAPVIGDGVVIGRDACVVGPVDVGRLSLIGAGSVVTRDVPELSVVQGTPGRVVRSRLRSEAPDLFERVLGPAPGSGRPVP